VKPHPPEHLLGPGQQWTVVLAEGWEVANGERCNRYPNGSRGGYCNREAVILLWHEEVTVWVEYLCDQHMGTHRWIDGGLVYQWRADPPWKYQTKTRVPYRRRRSKSA